MSSNEIVRVFHPTGPGFQDVPSGDVKDWVAQGWLSKSPGVVDESQHQAVGAFYIAQPVADPAPVQAAPEPAPKDAAPAHVKADK